MLKCQAPTRPLRFQLIASIEIGNQTRHKGISLSSTALNLKPQQTATLNAVLDPEGAQASLNWKSSDESIVRVSGNGTSAQLTAVNAGSAQVTVSSSDGKFTAACQITVSTSSQEAPGIVFAQTNMSLTVGQPQNISLTITPSGADVGKISWNASSIWAAVAFNAWFMA